MKRTIGVFLDDSADALGTLRYDRQGARERSSFSYSDDWLSDAQRFAIDPALPLVVGPQFVASNRGSSIFPGAIRDTEPDGWGRRVILREHARRKQAARTRGDTTPLPALGELDFLLAVDDESRVGALRFMDEEGIFQGMAPDGTRRASPLVELGQLLSASHALERSEETASDVAYLMGRGTSFGGLRPKCTVVDEDGHLAIGKFPSVSDERPVTKAEVLVLTLAQHAGINSAEARAVGCAGTHVAIIRRFDRTRQGARIPYISAATLLGADREDPREHSYTELVDALRVHGHDARGDIEELYRRIAFSIAVNNVDDHLNNHGLLHVGYGQWRLSPAFDINPFPDRVRELKTWISEESGPEASFDSLLLAAPRFGLSKEKARTAISHVVQVVGTWRKVGARLPMTKQELDSIAEAFEGAPRWT